MKHPSRNVAYPLLFDLHDVLFSLGFQLDQTFFLLRSCFLPFTDCIVEFFKVNLAVKEINRVRAFLVHKTQAKLSSRRPIKSVFGCFWIRVLLNLPLCRKHVELILVAGIERRGFLWLQFPSNPCHFPVLDLQLRCTCVLYDRVKAIQIRNDKARIWNRRLFSLSMLPSLDEVLSCVFRLITIVQVPKLDDIRVPRKRCKDTRPVLRPLDSWVLCILQVLDQVLSPSVDADVIDTNDVFRDSCKSVLVEGVELDACDSLVMAILELRSRPLFVGVNKHEFVFRSNQQLGWRVRQPANRHHIAVHVFESVLLLKACFDNIVFQ